MGRVPTEPEQSTRRRMLDAVHVVLSRSGHRNLQLSEVALEAGVSRPTIYRHFGSKEGLLEAFGDYELDSFDAGIAAAMAGLRGADRLDAALRFIVAFQNSYSARAVVEIEPEHVLMQMQRVMPILYERIRRVMPGDDADVAASAVVRIAICHYLVQGGTSNAFLAELRHAAGLAPRRRRSTKSQQSEPKRGKSALLHNSASM